MTTRRCLIGFRQRWPLASLLGAVCIGSACTWIEQPNRTSPAASIAAATPGAPLVTSSVGPLPPSADRPRSGPAPTPSEEAVAFAPPEPSCPAPTRAPTAPIVTVSVVGGSSIAATPFGSGLATCSTVGVDDGIPADPTKAFAVRPDDVLRLSLPAPWRFVRWSGSISDVGAGEGSVIWSPVLTADHPTSVAVVAVGPPGESIATFHLDVMTLDQRVVGYVDVRVRLDVR